MKKMLNTLLHPSKTKWSICLVSFGVYLFAKPLFSDIVILWIFVVLILLVSIILLIDGPLAKPKSRKTKTKSN